jgi:photosystem II stability/assembly factor-like uncharacterized protein
VLLFTLLTAAGLAQDTGWTQSASPTRASLRGLHAVSASLVWASGADATVLRTTDGGVSWKAVVVPGAEGLDFRDIHAWDLDHAVLMSAGPGAKSRVYVTADGGAHWTLAHQNQQEKGFFDSIAFWDRKRGALVGDPVEGRFTVLVTEDGGRSWRAVTGPPANEGEGAFAASGTSIAVGKDGRAWIGSGGEKGGRVFRSADWGRTWQSVETPIRHDAASAGIFSVFMLDAKRGYAAGGDYRKGTESAGSLIATEDGGASWKAVTGLSGYRSAMASAGPLSLFATGPEGSDHSTDGGKTWSPLPGPGFHALSVAGGRAWASGSEGRIAWRAVH